MSNPMFPGANRVTPLPVSGEAKTFTGDGTGRLSIPGCRAVAQVFVGGMEIERYHENKHPLDNTERPEYIKQSIPLWDLSETEDGIPCLVRNMQSNDGIWQDGATITVVGEWTADPAETLPKGKR